MKKPFVYQFNAKLGSPEQLIELFKLVFKDWVRIPGEVILYQQDDFKNVNKREAHIPVFYIICQRIQENGSALCIYPQKLRITMDTPLSKVRALEEIVRYIEGCSVEKLFDEITKTVGKKIEGSFERGFSIEGDSSRITIGICSVLKG